MSRRWEIAIQEWYAKAPTANLEYLDLAETKPTVKELARNIAVIFDRLSLSNRVNLKNFKQIQEDIEVLKGENQNTTEGRSVGLFMSYINTQATSSYKEALQATEAIEAPSLGFCKLADYKGALSGTIATIKQANTQIQLLVTILEKLESLEDRIKKIEAKANLEVSLPNEVIQELSNKIKGLTLKEKAKEERGKLLVFKDPYELFREQKKQ
ncbi:hypothetical protein ZIOFF_006040 [Zingiber officinale]|uniref:Uncharacterized protein n=1 Tax=Zingiber officinale TaxID=94328 RepID=A0A8J5IBW0_ZINOF|nr:hypothetical protein ZIOFF_006040 [Zingiber officinale]